MTSDAFIPLTDLERDALAELSNIAMARASNNLRQMIKNEVLLAVPSVEILTSAAAIKLVAKPDNPKLVAVRQDFVGAFSGPSGFLVSGACGGLARDVSAGVALAAAGLFASGAGKHITSQILAVDGGLTAVLASG